MTSICYRFDGRPLVRIENDSVHVMPFLGWLWVPSRFFTQGFLQVDVDANGNPVDVNLGRGLTQAGRYQDETFLYADLSSGYWLWQADAGSRRCLTGFAPDCRTALQPFAADIPMWSRKVRSALGNTTTTSRCCTCCWVDTSNWACRRP